MSLKHRWNYTDRGELKNSEKNLFDCNTVRHKSHAYWPGTEHGWGNSRCLSWQSYETQRSKNRVCGQNCRAWKYWNKWCIWHQAECRNVVTITARASFKRLAEKSRDKQKKSSFLAVSDFEITEIFITPNSASCVRPWNFLRIFTPVRVAFQAHKQYKRSAPLLNWGKLGNMNNKYSYLSEINGYGDQWGIDNRKRMNLKTLVMQIGVNMQ